MASYGFRQRILEVGEDGTALTNSTSATSLLPASASEAFIGAGQVKPRFSLLFEFSGRISTVVTTPGTLTLDLRAGSTAIFSSGAMTMNTTAQVNVHWVLRGELVCRVTGTGTSTTFFPKGCCWKSHAVIGSPAPTAGGAGEHMLPYNTAPAVGTGIDLSASSLLGLYGTWSVASASNSIQVHAGHIDMFVGG